MNAADYPLEVNQGAVFTETFFFKDSQTKQPINLTGYTAKSQVRPAPLSSTLLIDFTTSIDGPNGAVTISATVAQLANLPFASLGAPKTLIISAVWDLFLIDSGGSPQRFLKGQALLYPQVSA